MSGSMTTFTGAESTLIHVLSLDYLCSSKQECPLLSKKTKDARGTHESNTNEMDES